ncbi:MAG: autotransporter domain-containing protein [Alphaproteobacteria bacterium]|nr:autotransporter domain-containing protein [Alphaproteobacteria bacterium]
MNKKFHNFLMGVSVLPALAIMPAMADTVDSRHVITDNTTYDNLTASNIAESTANNGAVFYMEDVQDVTLTFNGTTSFTGNSLINGGMGGAIGSGWLSTHDVNVYPEYTPGGKIVFNGVTTFTNNTSNSANGAGAIFNYGLGNLESPDIKFNEAVTFAGNSATGSMNADIIGGGAIHHHGGMIVFDDVASFSQNTSASKGGAIISTGDMVFNDVATFNANTASSSGGAIAAMGGHITFDDTATFTENEASSASAIFATGASDITFNGAATFEDNIGTGTLMTNGSNNHIVFNNGATFNHNTNGAANGSLINAADSSISLNGGNFVFTSNTGGNGGGLKNAGTVTVNTNGNVLFEENTTISSAGAFDNGGTVTFTANKVSFIDNIANAGYGGAIFNAGDLSVLGNENIFTGNQAKDTGATKSGGGAIHNRGQAGTATLVIGVTNGTNEFTSNTSKAHGGAIVARAYDGQNQDSDVTINGTTTFTTNHADLDGGAIWNSVAPKGNTVGRADFVINGATTFTGNTAGRNGGAIFNADTMTLVNGVFSGNKANGIYTPNSQNTLATYADGKGGAIYNSGTLTVGGRFDNNTAFHGGAIYNNGMITVSDGATFAGNYANVEGGAIANYGNLTIGNNVTFDNNKAFIKEGDLDVTSGGSEMGAAIYSEGTGATRTVTIGDNVKFTNNYSPFGNVYFLNANNVTIGDNVEFSGNSSQKAAGIRTSSTGAGNSTVTIGDNAKFINNAITSATGAAAIRLYGDDVTIGKNAVFADNTGTAIYNGNSNIIFGSNVTFSGNKANVTDGIGGALVNHGVAVATFNSGVFSNNTATLAGGAIYNKGAAVVNFAGDLVFSGNMANGIANDIHNLGIVNVLSGTTTMDGGITGDGTLSIANGATLNVGTSTIEQGTITLDGTMLATLRNGDAQITAGTFDGNGTLKLSFAGEGTYHVFGDAAFRAAGIDATSSVYDITWAEGNKDLIATMKSAADIAEQNDIEQDAAKAIVGLNASTSEKLNDLGVKIQEKLAEGTPEAKHEVEHAAKAVHPEKESVTQSVASSVQTTVANLASARMAAPTIGRNGGDITMTSGGVWAQGLFNKSKQNDAFRGYTRGIAAGLDGTMNRVWTVGAGYSYAHSDISGSVRDTEIDSNTVFLYGQYKPAAWYVNAVAHYTMSDYSEEGDAMGTPVTADFDVDSFGMSVATGYDLDFGLTPELGLRYMHVMADDYTNSLGVKTKSDNTNFLTGVLGAKYAFSVIADRYTTFIPQLNAAIKYDMLSDKNVATITMPGVDAYTLDVERLSRFGGEFGIGLGMKYRGFDFSINYDIDVRKDYTSQTGMLKFRYNF